MGQRPDAAFWFQDSQCTITPDGTRLAGSFSVVMQSSESRLKLIGWLKRIQQHPEYKNLMTKH